MSKAFKIILATLSLVVTVIVSGIATLVAMFDTSWGYYSKPTYFAELLVVVLGPLALLLYILFLKKDLYFWSLRILNFCSF